MKVFLSHSTKDKHFIQALAAELETEKIEPWLCEVGVELGDSPNFVQRDRRLRTSAPTTQRGCGSSAESKQHSAQSVTGLAEDVLGGVVLS